MLPRAHPVAPYEDLIRAVLLVPDIHPLVIFLEPTSVAALISTAGQPLDGGVAEAVMAHTRKTMETHGHLFTHTIQAETRFADTVAKVYIYIYIYIYIYVRVLSQRCVRMQA